MLRLVVIFFLTAVTFALKAKDSLVGESVTLTCSIDIYNGYPIEWYYKDRDLYLTTDGSIYTNVQNAIKDRLSVECSRRCRGYNDVCTLNINPLMKTDSGTYECRYYDSVNNKRFYFDSVKINVSYGHLPSEESPICEIGINGRYMIQTNYLVRDETDEIDLRCSAEGSSISPSISWKREQHAIAADLTPYVKGKILFQKLNLTEDIGAVFTCFMKHPALPVRNCSITPLPVLSTTTAKSTTLVKIESSTNRPASQTSESDTSMGMANGSNTVASQHTFFLPLIIVLVITAIVAVVLATFLIKRRKKHNVIPSKLSYDISYDRDRTNTAEYAVVNAPNSTDQANKLKKTQKSPQEHFIIPECSSTADEENVGTLYAKPDKRRKPNNDIVQIDARGSTITADYTMVNAPNCIDRGNRLDGAIGNNPENSTIAEVGSSGTADEDACPLYAEPDKINNSNDLTTVAVEDHNQYDNLTSHPSSDEPAVAADEDGLMYADLDLTRAPESESARVPPINPDATVYADIKRAL